MSGNAMSPVYRSYAIKSGELLPLNSSTFSPTACLLATNRVIITECRYVRTFNNDEASLEGKRTGDASTSAEREETKQEQSEGAPKPDFKPDPATVRRLRIYVFVVASLSFVTSTGIDFQEFSQKVFEKNGEVQKILFVPSHTRAIAFLHPGAVVDGHKVKDNLLVINYPHNAQQFWADIRKEEAELGISLAQGVPINLYQGMTTFRMIELVVGVLILAFLGTQYGRLLRKRLLENKANKKQ
ncbi:unnamed protein product [Caenorhabditis auriculariae]|uniref:Uncharacterized protein n=1 Tax=Caenorhabditis auriculariae TaxID=2777116 RepID=A0A8S1HDX6_9PELO|nr:unnamed protein product [Caenorhabditis auriculariae]